MFITLEGIDGAGKSTQLAFIAELLTHQLAGRAALVQTREPGGTALGEQLRALLLHQAMHPDTQALLMFAARREHLAQVIQPALQRGDWVLCDRFSDASYAYQGGGHGVPNQRLALLEQFTHAELQPHLTLLFDLDPTLAAQRRSARDADTFEAQAQAFHERTRAAYLARAQAEPQRFRVIDASGTPEQIRHNLQTLVAAL